MIAIHAIAAILFLGPATVANSQFHVRAYDAHNGNTQAAGSAKTLFKISQSYGMLSLLVPLLGIAIMLLDWSFYKSEASSTQQSLSVLSPGRCFSSLSSHARRR